MKQHTSPSTSAASRWSASSSATTIIREYMAAQGPEADAAAALLPARVRNVIPNTEKSYKALGGLVSDARLAGLIDWDAIEDRNREPVIWAEYENVQELVEDPVPLPPAALGGAGQLRRAVGGEGGLGRRAAPAREQVPRHPDGQPRLLQPVAPCTSPPSGSWRRAEDKNPILFYLGTTTRPARTWCGTSRTAWSCSASTTSTCASWRSPWSRSASTTRPRTRPRCPTRAPPSTSRSTGDSWEVDALNPRTLAQIIETRVPVRDRHGHDERNHRQGEEGAQAPRGRAAQAGQGHRQGRGIDDATAEAHSLEEEAWDYLREFGGHTAECCQGIFRGEKILHPPLHVRLEPRCNPARKGVRRSPPGPNRSTPRRSHKA
jgi:hypothetical protein